jgi:hypothetical protein
VCGGQELDNMGKAHGGVDLLPRAGPAGSGATRSSGRRCEQQVKHRGARRLAARVGTRQWVAESGARRAVAARGVARRSTAREFRIYARIWAREFLKPKRAPTWPRCE